MPKRQTEVFSIFDQIETVAAEIMIEKGEITKIEAKDIPREVAYNDFGMPARFAVIVPAKKLAKFNNLIADLRA